MGEISDKKLRWRKRLFVQKLMELKGNQTQAAIAAGYAVSRAKQTGRELMQDQWVQAAIEEAKQEVRGITAYNYEQGMSDLAEDIDLARKANQHNAVKGFRELMLRMNGQLIDKLQVEMNERKTIDIRIAIEEGRGRAGLPPLSASRKGSEVVKDDSIRDVSPGDDDIFS